MNKRLRHLIAIGWLAIIICFGIYSAQSLFLKDKIQFDLLALLPESKTENMRLSNGLMKDGNVSGRLVIAFGHENPEQAKEALLQLREQLTNVDLLILEHSVKEIDASYKTLFSDLYKHRTGLLSKDDRKVMQDGVDGLLVKRAMANMMSPFGSFDASQLNSDPFGFFPRFAASFLPNHSMQTDSNGNLSLKFDGKTWAIFQGEVNEKIFSLTLQEKISETLMPLLSKIEKETGTEVLRVGAAFYASAGAQQAKGEISSIGLISTAGIILILLLIFRVPNPIFLAVAVVSSGLICGLAACLFLFGSVHILALVFGCSLVGVAVDYALHYYCASFKPVDRFQILSLLLPAMPLGVLTSAIGYGALIVAPFPGIQQMAVLACMGLLSTFISVSVWGPYFIKSGERKPPQLGEKIQSCMERLAALGSIKNLKPAAIAVMLVLFCTGAWMISFDDDVRNFQAMNPQLKKEEEKIKAMMHFDNTTKFLAVSDRNLESLLQKEEAIAQNLEKNGISYRALSDLIPSQKRQQENTHLMLNFSEAHYPKIVKALESDQSFNRLKAGFTGIPMIPTIQFLKNLPTGWKELIHVADDGRITGRVMINGMVDSNLIGKDQAAAYVDPVREYSSLFAAYRKVMMMLVAFLLIVFALMISLYKGTWASITVTTPVLLSILTTIGIIGLLGVNFSMFHAMGLILVLCIGIDYALFLYWRKPEEKELLLLGNTLAAVTTILSFGLLALSTTAAVYSFGMTVFIGIVLNFFITTLLLGRVK